MHSLNVSPGGLPHPVASENISNTVSTTAATPIATAQRWRGLLRDPDFLASHPSVARLIDDLSKGVRSVATVKGLNELIQQEELRLFVELFHASDSIERRQAQATGKTHESHLTFRMPPDWAPRHHSPEEIAEVFGKIHVQRVVVGPEPGRRGTVAPDHFPTALTPALAALLANGTTELVLLSPLASTPAFVAALPGSSLASITLWRSFQASTVPSQALQSFRDVMAGLSTCGSLKKLVLGNPALLSFHECLGGFKAPSGPALESVHLHGHPWDQVAGNSFDALLPNFMAMLRGFLALQKVVVHSLWARDTPYLNAAILSPLAGHKALTHLSIGTRDWEPGEQNMLFLHSMAAFIRSCPSLTEFAYMSERSPHNDLRDRLDDAQRAGLNLNPAAAKTALANALTGPNPPKLTSLKITGVYLCDGPLGVLFDALTPTGALHAVTKVDLSECVMGLAPPTRWVRALVDHQNFSTFELPAHENFHIRTSDGQFHRVKVELLPTNEVALQLALRDNLGDAQRAAAIAQFADIEEEAHALMIDPQLQRDRLLHAALAQEALSPLMEQVASLLAAAHAPHQNSTTEEISPQLFMLQAAELMDYLGSAASTMSATQIAAASPYLNRQNSNHPATADTLTALQRVERRLGGGVTVPATSTSTSTAATTATTTTTTTTATTTATTTSDASHNAGREPHS